MKTILLAAVVSLFLAACGPDAKGPPQPTEGAITRSGPTLDGTFVTEDGKHKLTFSSDHKVKGEQFGKPIETTYVLEEKSVKFTFPGGVPLTYTINADDSLTAPGLARYVKTN